ncbi:MAG: hypothetical protein JXA93_00705 [Anaerolineae bacterium]|nr:hypothetical protein [Anaerolineae bacterium]
MAAGDSAMGNRPGGTGVRPGGTGVRPGGTGVRPGDTGVRTGGTGFHRTDARVRVEVTDREGWRKEFPLERPLLYIGSDPMSDVVLDAQHGGGVAPRHLQLIALPAAPGGSREGAGLGSPWGGYRAINLSDRDVFIGEAGGRTLPPRAAIEIVDGDMMRVGDFALVFYAGASEPGSARVPTRLAAPAGEQAARERREPVPVPMVQMATRDRSAASVAPMAAEGGLVSVEKHSAHMGLRLSLPRARVEPEFPLEGAILLRNLGEEQGVQFRVEVKGLHPDLYQVGPGPILFPNVEKGVYLRLQHPCGPGVAAGQHQIQIRASAPDAYPGEEVCVTHEIEIVPYYHHTLTLTVVD